MESKTNCPCDLETHNNCFVEKTEIEGEPFESYICFKCGMTSNTYLAFDSDKLEEYTKNHSQLMNDLKIFDEERGIVWFPSVINMEKYDGHERRLDVDNAQKFGQFEFMEACKSMGIIKDNG